MTYGKLYRNVAIDGDHVSGEYVTTRDGEPVGFADRDPAWTSFQAYAPLLRISMALDSHFDQANPRIWALQDGYGSPGFTPEQGWDWSGIRDSTPEAIEAMETVAREFVDDAEFLRRLGVSS